MKKRQKIPKNKLTKTKVEDRQRPPLPTETRKTDRKPYCQKKEDKRKNKIPTNREKKHRNLI